MKLLSFLTIAAFSVSQISFATYTKPPGQIAKGFTDQTTFTPYSLITGGTTATGSLQSVASVGTSGQVLTSNGAGALPTFQAAGGSSATVLYVTNDGSPTYGAQAVVKFQHKVIDTASGYSTTTGLYTVPTTGKYLVTSSLTFSTIGNWGTGGTFSIYIQHGAPTVQECDWFELVTNNGNSTATCPGIVIQATAGDTISTQAGQSGGTNINGNGANNMSSMTITYLGS